MRPGFALAVLVLAACSGGEADPRLSEIWRIDLLTHEGEVDHALAGLGIERSEIELPILAWLNHYFGNLPIFFELGPAEGGPFKSSVCLRAVDDTAYGWGVLDEGNTRAVHACGNRDG